MSAATAAGAFAPPRRPLRRRVFGRQPLGLAFVTPYVVFLAAIFAYPIGFSVYMSLHDYFFAAPGAVVARPWVGLHNFSTALSDPDVRGAFAHVAVFALINVPLTVAIALGLAVALNAALPYRGFLRVAYYIPYVTASVAVVAVWLWLFSNHGIVNTVLGPLAPKPTWLVNSHLVMPMIAVFVAWKQAGFFILLYLAALQNVPRELYDAAAMDGASKWRSFLNVTVPGVRPATVLVVVLATITGANLFTEPYLLTNGGGPDGASTTPVLLMYQRGIEQGHPDVAAAIGIILVGIVLVLSLVSRRFLEARD
jgi:multiple sugar transport system permease protein